MEESDFWWLPKDVNSITLLVGVGHHPPLTDDDEPQSVQWFHSLTSGNRPSVCQQLYPLNFVSQWRSVCKNTNVYRTLKVYTRSSREKEMLGTFLIDIDNSHLENGYRDLEDALDVTRKAVDILTHCYGLATEKMRIFFSGRKGFNIEVRPAALNISGSFDDQTKLSAKKLDEIIAALRQVNGVTNSSTNAVSNQGTVIDRIYGNRFSKYRLKHPYIRLHRSINKWARMNGNQMARMKIEVSLNELCSRNAKDISSKAETLVSDALDSQ